MKRELPIEGQVLEAVEHFDKYEAEQGRFETDDIDTANVITSMVKGSDKHKIVLDLDLPAKLIESTTPGHFHLYIDHEVEWDDYSTLLGLLARMGIIEQGYSRASRARRFTAVRLPWIKKEAAR